MNQHTIHTPGKIRFQEEGDANRFAMLTEDGRWLLTLLHNGEAVSERQAENMRRLAAAWNACDGLSTRTIEILGQLGGVTSKMPAVAALAVQRDELLEMVKTLSAELFAQAGDSARAMHYVEQARALAAKVEAA